jgi:hypothetical protein
MSSTVLASNLTVLDTEDTLLRLLFATMPWGILSVS